MYSINSVRTNYVSFVAVNCVGNLKPDFIPKAKLCIKRLGPYCHDSSAAQVEISKAIAKMKQRAEDTMESTAKVINESTIGLSQAVNSVIPNSTTLKKAVTEERSKISAAPTSLKEIINPGHYNTYKSEKCEPENILIANSSRGSQTILLFRTLKIYKL